MRTRREFLTAAGAVAVAGGLRPLAAFSQGKDILLGSVLDNSGNLDIYGKPMVMATSSAAVPPAASTTGSKRAAWFAGAAGGGP